MRSHLIKTAIELEASHRHCARSPTAAPDRLGTSLTLRAIAAKGNITNRKPESLGHTVGQHVRPVLDEPTKLLYMLHLKFHHKELSNRLYH